MGVGAATRPAKNGSDRNSYRAQRVVTVARRRALSDLTPEQLKDMGNQEAHRSKLEIKAGLITNLMSMK